MSEVPHHPVDSDEVLWFLGPRGQIHVTHQHPVVPHAQAVAVAVDKHLWEVVELRYQLLWRRSNPSGQQLEAWLGRKLAPQWPPVTSIKAALVVGGPVKASRVGINGEGSTPLTQAKLRASALSSDCHGERLSAASGSVTPLTLHHYITPLHIRAPATVHEGLSSMYCTIQYCFPYTMRKCLKWVS